MPPDDSPAPSPAPAVDDHAGPMPCSVAAPARQTAPLVFASPHSGRDYPPDFIAASRLDALTLRRSEDAFMEEVFAAAPELGAPLLRAHFPRAYVDPNRERLELDPRMFEGRLPAGANTASPWVAAGLGTIARVISSGDEIYAARLSFAEARDRIEASYDVYHRTLRDLVEATRRRFGGCLLIDCHSMPSVGGPTDRDPGLKRVDVVLGDGHGTTCAGAVTNLAQATLEELGYVVRRNTPYAGGFTTRHYGRPAEGVHVLQIEVNRILYMDETTITRGPGLPGLAAKARRLIEVLAGIDARLLAAP